MTLETEPMQARRPMSAPLYQFACCALVILVGVMGLAYATFGGSSAFVVSVASFLLISAIVARGMIVQSISHFGAANGVTAMRAGLVAVVSGAIFALPLDPIHAWFIFAFAVLAFAMDGLDGYLARRNRTATAFGARFDMEIDALFGAILSLIILQSGTVGPHILLLGFMRYGFVIAGYIWPWLNNPLPESLRRKTVCVVQIAALLLLICPAIPAALIAPISLIALAALLWSFAADTTWLMRTAS